MPNKRPDKRQSRTGPHPAKPHTHEVKKQATSTDIDQKAANAKEFAEVISAVRDFIYENHRLPQVNDIVERTGIQATRCNEIVDQLVRQKLLYVVFDGKGLPRVLILYEMMQGALAMQKKPSWVSAHGYPKKTELAGQVEKLNKEIIGYEQLERLLYATDIPLEDAIAHALEVLEFQNVVHHRDDSDNPDVTFEYEGIKALLEAEGANNAGDKKKILQLNGWALREISQGRQASQMKCFFVVNHYRDTEPSKRGEALTRHAKEFLKHCKYSYFTTLFLFDIVKSVKDGTMTAEKARKEIWQGQEIQ